MQWPAISLRAGMVAGALLIWYWTQSLIARKAALQGGMGDVVHELTAGWHQFFCLNPKAPSLLQRYHAGFHRHWIHGCDESAGL